MDPGGIGSSKALAAWSTDRDWCSRDGSIPNVTEGKHGMILEQLGVQSDGTVDKRLVGPEQAVCSLNDSNLIVLVTNMGMPLKGTHERGMEDELDLGSPFLIVPLQSLDTATAEQRGVWFQFRCQGDMVMCAHGVWFQLRRHDDMMVGAPSLVSVVMRIQLSRKLGLTCGPGQLPLLLCSGLSSSPP